MKAQLVLLASASALGLAVSTVGEDSAPVARPGAQRTSSAGPWSVGQAAALKTDEWASGQVALARESDGHFYADVTIDGATSRMLVDTGATTIALTGEDAEAAGVTWEPEDVQPVAQGAGGPVYGVRVKLDTVALGEIEAREVEAVVVPEGLGISLLGQSFLGRIGHVDIQSDKMVLGD